MRNDLTSQKQGQRTDKQLKRNLAFLKKFIELSEENRDSARTMAISFRDDAAACQRAGSKCSKKETESRKDLVEKGNASLRWAVFTVTYFRYDLQFDECLLRAG